jgi:hypothetical protein
VTDSGRLIGLIYDIQLEEVYHRASQSRVRVSFDPWAIYEIQDFQFTGMGMDTFGHVMPVLIRSFLSARMWLLSTLTTPIYKPRWIWGSPV